MQYFKKISQSVKSLSSKHLIILIFIIAFITYGNSLSNGFVLDDIGQIVNNPNIQSFKNLPGFFSGGTFYSPGAANLAGIYYRPILSMAFATNYAIWNQNSFGFHLFSVLLHAINASLLYLLLKKLLNLENYKHSNCTSFLISIIFLVHPVNTEAISYISSVQEPLFVFFLMMALYLTVSWIREKELYPKKLFLINFLVLCSLLSKEAGVLSIPIILIFIYLFNKSKFIAAVISLTSTFILYLFMRFGIAHMALSTTADAPPIVHATFIQRLLTIPFELFSYIRLVLFPKDLFVSQQFVIKSVTDPRFYISLPIVLTVIILLVIPAFKLKSKLYIFFLFWMILFFSILLNIFPLDFSLTERWLYGPLTGILGALGVLILNIPEKYKKIQTFLFVAIVLTIPILIARTVIRNKDWKDNMTIVSHDLRLNPDSYELQGDYGTLLGMNGDQNGAKEHIQRSLELSPTWWTMRVNLGIIYEREMNFEKAEKEYLLVIDKTNDCETFERLAILKYKTIDPRNAVDFTAFGLKHCPTSANLNFVAALSYYKLGDKVSALTYAQRTYYLHPSTQTSTAIQRISDGQNIDDLLK